MMILDSGLLFGPPCIIDIYCVGSVGSIVHVTSGRKTVCVGTADDSDASIIRIYSTHESDLESRITEPGRRPAEQEGKGGKGEGCHQSRLMTTWVGVTWRDSARSL